MFGCGCLVGTDVDALSDQLSYLYHYHLADSSLRTRAQPERFVEMNRKPKDEIDARAVFAGLPPLIKGYLRLGACVGDGAVIDRQWNSVDVCIIVPCERLAQRYTKHFARQDSPSYAAPLVPASAGLTV
jgi:L-ornithine Nalpha-acyltransferase